MTMAQRHEASRARRLAEHEAAGIRSTWQVVRELDGLVSYRQIDHWLRRGAITCSVPADGCGSQRMFTVAEVEAIRVLASELDAARVVQERALSGERWRELMEAADAGS